jgi:hypothetical protein
MEPRTGDQLIERVSGVGAAAFSELGKLARESLAFLPRPYREWISLARQKGFVLHWPDHDDRSRPPW